MKVYTFESERGKVFDKNDMVTFEIIYHIVEIGDRLHPIATCTDARDAEKIVEALNLLEQRKDDARSAVGRRDASDFLSGI